MLFFLVFDCLYFLRTATPEFAHLSTERQTQWQYHIFTNAPSTVEVIYAWPQISLVHTIVLIKKIRYQIGVGYSTPRYQVPVCILTFFLQHGVFVQLSHPTNIAENINPLRATPCVIVFLKFARKRHSALHYCSVVCLCHHLPPNIRAKCNVFFCKTGWSADFSTETAAGVLSATWERTRNCCYYHPPPGPNKNSESRATLYLTPLWKKEQKK